MRLRLYSPIVTGLLIFSLAINAYQCKHAADEKENRYRDARTAQATIATQTARIESAQGRIDSLSTRLTNDSLSASVSLSGLRMRVATLLKSLPKRVLSDINVANIRDSVQLEVISLQDSLVSGMGITAQVQVKALRDVISLKDQQLKAKDEIIAVHAAELDGEKLKTKKERRGKNFFRGLWGVTVVGAVVLLSR